MRPVGSLSEAVGAEVLDRVGGDTIDLRITAQLVILCP